jgi:hypothetical protein
MSIPLDMILGVPSCMSCIDTACGCCGCQGRPSASRYCVDICAYRGGFHCSTYRPCTTTAHLRIMQKRFDKLSREGGLK